MRQDPIDGVFYAYYESPIGLIEARGTSGVVTALHFAREDHMAGESHPALRHVVRQLAEYFAGTRQAFEVESRLDGTDFQMRVWRQLLTVSFGRAVSYQDIANAIGRPKATRAVGAAVGRNPLSIIVPCHRVIGRDGSLTGYGGGLWRKEWLLKHEGITLA